MEPGEQPQGRPMPTRDKSTSSVTPVSSPQGGECLPPCRALEEGPTLCPMSCRGHSCPEVVAEVLLASKETCHTRALWDAASLITSYLVHFPFGKKQHKKKTVAGAEPLTGGSRASPKCC